MALLHVLGASTLLGYARPSALWTSSPSRPLYCTYYKTYQPRLSPSPARSICNLLVELEMDFRHFGTWDNQTHELDGLNSDPMRITKKFAGASCIGKRVFMPVERTPENLIETHRSQRDLEEMARKFQNRLENMRPGGSGRSSSANSKSSSVQSSPKTRRSTAQAAGAGGANPGVNGSTASSGNVSGARHAAETGPCRPGSALVGGAGEGVEGRRAASRSPSPGAHGPHSACDDSAPHPEGSPSHRGSWDREDGEGYGHYEPMDQSPSVDSETSSSSSSRAQGYSSGRSASGSTASGVGGYGAAGTPNAIGYGSGGGSVGGHSMGFGKCQYEDCVKGERRPGAGPHGGAAAGESQSGFLGGHGNSHQRQQQHQQQGQHNQGADTAFARHGQRRPYTFSLSGSSSGDVDDNDGVDDETPGGTGVAGVAVAGAAAGSGAGHSSSMTAPGRVSSWSGRSGPSGGLGPKPSSEPRTLPPGALSTANAGREGGTGGGSGSRSPTWPLPRSIPEGSEISDHDAGGLLLGFFRSVHEKVQTAANELEEVRERRRDGEK